MCNTKAVIVLAFCLYVGLDSIYSQWLAHGQMTRVNSSVNNNTALEFMTNKNMSSDMLNDTPRIMQNTSGMIDEAFDALKDTFKSLFGK